MAAKGLRFAGERLLDAARCCGSVDGGGDLTQESDVDGTSHNYPSARVAANYTHDSTRAARRLS